MNGNNSLNNLLQQGHYFLERGQYEQGLEIFQQADSLFSDCAEVKYSLGLTYCRLEQYEESIRYLNIALEINPDLEQASQAKDIILEKINNRQPSQTDFNFLSEILQTIASGAEKEQVYLLFQQNLNKLNLNLVKALQIWTEQTLPTLELEQQQVTRYLVAKFSKLIQQFPLGIVENNIEIALKTYEILLNFCSKQDFILDWAFFQHKLGRAYASRIKGNRIENLKKAVSAYKQAMEIYKQQKLDKEIAITRADLAAIYLEKVKEKQTVKKERIILACAEALKIDDKFTSVSKERLLIVDKKHKKYLSIIENLIYFPQKDKEIIQSHEHLIDAEFLDFMYKVFLNIESEHIDAANYLFHIHQQLSQLLSFTETEKYKFFVQILTMIEQKVSDEQIYSVLEQNLDKIDYQLAQATEGFIEKVSSLTLEEKQSFAYNIFRFGNLLHQFNLGSKKNKLKIAEIAYSFFSDVFNEEEYPHSYAIAQVNLGLIYLQKYNKNRQENIESAIVFFESAQRILTESKEPLLWAQLQHNLGLIYRERIAGDRKENIELAIAAHTAALTKYTENNHPRKWADSQTNLGSCYIFRIAGDRKENVELAIAAHIAALRVLTETNYPRFWGMTRSNLGMAYMNRVVGDKSENRELAISNYTSALKVVTEETLPLDWARMQNDLGVAYRERIKGDRKENIELAIVAHTSALRVLTETNYPQLWATVHVNLCACYSTTIAEGTQDNQRNIELAIASCKQALQIFTEKDFPQDWATTQHNLGVCYVMRIADSKTKNIKLAIKAYTAALKIRTPQFDPVSCLNTSRGLGSLHLKEGNWEQAIDAYSVAVKAVEQVREWAINDENKEEVISDTIEVYQNIVQAYINLGQIDKAIEYVERSKTRNLVDLLATRDLYPNGEIPQSIIDSLDNLRRNITTEQKRLSQLRNSYQNNMGDSSQEDTRSVSTNLEQNLTQDRERLNSLYKSLDYLIKTHIQQIDPSFQLTQKVEPICYEKIKQTLPNQQTVIIEWFIGNETVSTFIVTSQQTTPIHISYTEEQFQALGEAVNRYYDSYRQRDRKWHNTLSKLLTELAQSLKLSTIVRQIKQSVPDCNQLILVPHRWLHLLPIHALPLSDGKCLLDLFPNGVSYAPSVQLLELTQKQNRTSLTNLFSVQNPTEDLQFTNLEVTAIRSQFAPHDDVLVGKEARKQALTKERLSIVNLAHFSCHGTFNFENPELSALLLANSKIDSQFLTKKQTIEREEKTRYLPDRDGGSIDLEQCLTLGEIFSLDLRNCRLVTLSACETGITDFRSLSDEYIGLPSGFLFAGSPSVVSSLWTVSDLSTSFLMIKFYQTLQKMDSVPVALNQAQLWLRSVKKEELYQFARSLPIPNYKILPSLDIELTECSDDSVPFASPYHWAAFFAVGS